ncbi:MAG: cysteine synthase family protein [Chloroherpetonaceae bacterium]|nr:cysteine synthase family protein [Chloroherpetonaceae bacterium]MCS7211180.1 cysteine synthase family protein [Chloroherpetonaceae bacterium]MDW8020321.1 cysteine synthase family protein [Chloroherpetonaceae bacterium]MDW8466481.1 cysteine synthase family protein [Chloroherpetonaceae bacterium]
MPASFDLSFDLSKARQSVLSLIGNTPLVRLQKLPAQWGIPDSVEIYGKCEFMNPGGSVKDRPALNIIETAEAQGLLTKDKILLDATSGNTGIAYAMICAIKGYKVQLCVPESASPERKRILQAYGADIIYTPASESSDGAILKARELYAKHPERYFYADQYGNDANWLSHYHGTGVEIWEQTSGRITHFIAAIGTSGSFIGTSRRLKAYNPAIECIAVQPDVAVHGIEGIKHLESAMVPKIYDPSVPDRFMEVSTETAYEFAKRLAATEGLLVGISAAANVYASLKVAKQLSEQGEPATIVCILCDGGMKYLSEHFWEMPVS